MSFNLSSDVWARPACRGFPNYASGSWGPIEADDLLDAMAALGAIGEEKWTSAAACRPEKPESSPERNDEREIRILSDGRGPSQARSAGVRPSRGIRSKARKARLTLH